MDEKKLNGQAAPEKPERKVFFFEYLTHWIGSISSLVVHTLLFGVAFILGVLGIAPWDSILLVLTTIVSLEAIYLSIFIQMTVNRHAESLKEVEEDVEDIQEDIEEITEDVEGIQEDIEEITEDVEDIQEDVEELNEDDVQEEAMKKQQLVSLDQLTKDVQRVLADLEKFKKQ
ncbi:MAG: DUF1003 domain-containing protein [Patescibacteria group bacterium]